MNNKIDKLKEKKLFQVSAQYFSTFDYRFLL